MPTPVRFPFGVSTNDVTQPLGNFGLPDPTKWYVFFDDFNSWVTDTSAAGKYTITTVEAGGGSATETLADVAGGVLLLTNDDADNDSDFLQKIGESVLMVTGKKTFFKARFAVSDATQSDWIMGLQITDTTPLAAGGDGATDGVFFQKDDGDTNIDFYVMKNTTTGQSTSTAIATAAAAAAYMTVAFYFDGKRFIHAYVDDVQKARVDLTTTPADFIPDTEITVSFGIQNGEAVAKTMSIDYVFVAQER